MTCAPYLAAVSRRAVIALLLMPAAVAAQSVSNTGNSDADIVVTATRRSVELQKLPAAVTAIGEARIEAIGARAKDDIAYISPGVSFTDTGAGRQTFTIRGVQALSGEATTALYIDETPVARGAEAQFDIRLFDIDRVEILRGPQGTLFGASSMGGAIRVITRKPDLQNVGVNFDARLSGVRNGNLGFDVNAAVNIPIIKDKLALRIVGFRERIAGFIDNFDLTIDPDGAAVVGPLVERNVGDRDLYGVRAALKLQATDELAVTATYYLQDSKFNGVAGEDNDPTDPGSGLVTGALRQSRAFIERPGNNAQQYNLTAEYTGEHVAVISSTSYSRGRDTAQEDFTRRFGAAFGIPELDVFQVARGEEFTQEARIVSQGDGRFNWLVGGFYTDSKQRAVQELRDRTDPALGSLFTFQSSNPNTEYSFFGELSYKLSDRLTASGGVRRYTVTRRFDNLTLAGPLSGPEDDRSVGEATLRGWTYKALLSLQANDNNLVYTTVASGYRPGGPNSSVPSVDGPITPPPFAPDKVTNFEVGWKSSWFDRKLTLNMAAYYLLWDRIQVPVSDPSGDFTFTGNGGKAHSLGFEVELQAEPAKGLVFNATASALSARFDNDVPTLGVLDNDRLPSVPEFTASLQASYSGQLTPDLGFFATGLYSYTGVSFSNLTRDADNNIATLDRLGRYSLVNLEAGLNLGTASISLYVRNLGDTRGLVGRRRSGTFGAETQQYVQPRTLGIAVRASF